MKALRLHHVGSLNGLRWEDVPTPAIDDYEVLVKIKAVSLNFRDYGFITGIYPLVKELPLTLGSDAAGVVEGVGKKVTAFKSGDSVVSLLRQKWYGGNLSVTKAAAQLGGTVEGVFSEHYAFHENSLVRAPLTLSHEEAATLPTAGLTAFRVLTQSGLISGQRVLIQGTGGVSLFALQLACRMGFETWVTTGKKENEELLKVMGANHVINYKAIPNWHSELLNQTNQTGVDLVIDVAGGDSIQQSIDAVAYSGEVAIVGFLKDTQSTINLITAIRKNVRLSAYTTGSKDDLQNFVGWLEVNPIKPVISGVYSNFEEAFKAFERRDLPGKVVVSI